MGPLADIGADCGMRGEVPLYLLESLGKGRRHQMGMEIVVQTENKL